MDGIARLVPGKSDLELAEEYRERLLKLLAPISEALTEAAQAGLTVNFGFAPPDSFKRVNLAALEISKKLC